MHVQQSTLHGQKQLETAGSAQQRDMAERCVTWHTSGQRSIFAGQRAFVCWSHLRDGALRFSSPLSAGVVCRNHGESAQRAEE